MEKNSQREIRQKGKLGRRIAKVQDVELLPLKRQGAGHFRAVLDRESLRGDIRLRRESEGL